MTTTLESKVCELCKDVSPGLVKTERGLKTCPHVFEDLKREKLANIQKRLGDFKKTATPEQSKGLERFDGALYAYGANGKGKSTLAAMIAAKWSGGVEIYVGFELAELFRREFRDGFEYWSPPPPEILLVVDDIDKVKMTDFVAERIFGLFNLVEREQLSLVATGNLNAKQYGETFPFNYRGAIEHRVDKIGVEL